MANSSIEFKCTSFSLSVLHLKTSVLADVRAILTKKIAQAPDLFNLVPVVVNIEEIAGEVDYLAIKELIQALNFTFVGFTGAIEKEQKLLIRKLGFSFVNSAKKSSTSTGNSEVSKAQSAVKVFPEKTALYSDKVHRGQIRSGQQVYAQGQNLVVIGSVSAGAEVIADGNIHVYGALRGRAIAGAKGHQQAQIYCQNLEAELVSINGNYWLSESMEQHWASPVYIHLNDNELTSSKLI